jgi:hypothetical protein
MSGFVLIFFDLAVFLVLTYDVVCDYFRFVAPDIADGYQQQYNAYDGEDGGYCKGIYPLELEEIHQYPNLVGYKQQDVDDADADLQYPRLVVEDGNHAERHRHEGEDNEL